jgi:phenylacetate-coenzyme A ligase PaaK-like adenylate-forming protein
MMLGALRMISVVDEWIEKSTGARNSEELLEYQTRRLNETVWYVRERSSFYKKMLKNHRGEISLTEIPFTFPEDVGMYSAEMLCVSQSEVSRVVTHRTSGTVAPFKRVFFAECDLASTVDFFEHGIREFTNEFDTVLILFPGKNEGSIGRLLAEGLKRFNAEPLIYGIVSDFDDLFRFIANRKINVIAGMPHQLLELSRLCRHRGVGIHCLHSVLLSADHAAEALVEAVEKNLDCLVYEHYGMTEMCFGGGVYSKERNGYHLRHGDFLFEIVDPVTGEHVPRGEHGEVCFTSLHTGAMPLLRYRTGDLARFSALPGKYPVLEKVTRRTKGALRLENGGAATMAEFDEILFKNENVLDFNVCYADNTLTFHVHALRFDADEILETIQSSPLGGLFNDIRVFPMSKRHIENNTMNKRNITFCAR